MPTQKPRINIVLEKPLYEAIRLLARRDGVSLSLKVRDLLMEATDQGKSGLEEFRKLASWIQKEFKKKGITKKDIEKAIQWARKN